MIHRDLTPVKVLFSYRDYRALLTDVGVTRALSDPASRPTGVGLRVQWPTSMLREDGVRIDKRLGVPLVPIEHRIQEESEDGVEKGEKAGWPCWQIDRSPSAWRRASGLGVS